jgi:hypothetical protein
MRKVLLTALPIFLIIAIAFTIEGYGQNGNRKQTQKHTYFVDKNGDGVCDNSGTFNKSPNFIDENGDGICDNQGTGNKNGKGGKGNKGKGGNCTNFVDANGDGVCDNPGSATCTGCNGGKGIKGKCGNCTNFIDANGDGICDNKGTGNCCEGNGKGKGNGNCKSKCGNISSQVQIYEAYPNPFNQSVTLKFETFTEGVVTAGIYDVNGNLIKELYNSNMAIGVHELIYSPENIIPGRYFFTVKIGNITKSRAIVFAQ